MSLSKKILKHPRTESAVSWLLAMYIRLVYVTSRKIRIVDDAALPYIRGEQNGIFAFWHGRMMLLPAFEPPRRKMHVLISLHRDGLLISRVIGQFGEATISGSSSKGGKAAVMEMLRVLRAGDNISITPDGPRGPLQVAAAGIVTVARLSGKPVIPVTFSSTRHKRLKSWDRFMIALPFGRIAFCVGAPLPLQRDMDETQQETARLQVEHAMNVQVEKADSLTHA
jgi:lysophospholipid acyltransferase (LPLAT)-like uncharacterized protein